MVRDVLNPEFWRRRLEEAPENDAHHAIFKCPRPTWDKIAERHQHILKEVIMPNEKILDVGCGWGRLLDLMPDEWVESYNRQYYGVDVSPDFVAMGQGIYGSDPTFNPENGDRIHFYVGDVRDVLQGWYPPNPTFDTAIMISVRPMISRKIDRDWET